MSDSRGPVYISSGSSHGSGRYHAGSSYGGSYSYPDRERYASITTLHRPALPHSRSLTSLVGEPSITVIPPTRSRSRSELGYEPQYTEDGKLRVATMIRRLFGLGPKPVDPKVHEGSNNLLPKLRRKGSKSSSHYVYPTPTGPRQPVQAVYRTH
ncbi:hypothetical protein RSOLAG22IIIB_02258 [Rhizoctonia solani]|uniref:Uncharacterized protein n=1 Tax=Rhizoctonia solani TaxID=456999 RepID=A0A0K6GEG8_9AGAM|nr:hypothetical protein RSOLAG22IIIB_02258 [Rhizoctonia solani]